MRRKKEEKTINCLVEEAIKLIDEAQGMAGSTWEIICLQCLMNEMREFVKERGEDR